MSESPPKDPRHIDAVETHRAYGRYRRQRLACRGFTSIVALTRAMLAGARWQHTLEDLDVLAYRLIDELARRAALDLVGAGEEDQAREHAREREARRAKKSR